MKAPRRMDPVSTATQNWWEGVRSLALWCQTRFWMTTHSSNSEWRVSPLILGLVMQVNPFGGGDLVVDGQRPLGRGLRGEVPMNEVVAGLAQPRGQALVPVEGQDG